MKHHHLAECRSRRVITRRIFPAPNLKIVLRKGPARHVVVSVVVGERLKEWYRGMAKSCVVIELHEDVSHLAISWLTDKITASRVDRGCQLELDKRKTKDGRTLLITSASDFRLRVGAEIFAIRKRYKDGGMREYCVNDEKNFLNSEDDDFIADCEGLFIIKSELDSLRALVEDKCVPGHEHLHLYPGKSILQKMLKAKLITNILCLHDQLKLDKLGMKWFYGQKFTGQPIEEIRNYFGDSIGMYFSFLGHYTNALVPLVLLVTAFYTISRSWDEVQSYSGYAVLNIIWAAMFLETWKRKGAEVAYKFGNFQKRDWEEPRSSYHGPLGVNPVTGRKEPCYPPWKRRLRIAFISVPPVTLCILLAISLMFYYFRWDAYFHEIYHGSDTMYSRIVQNLPSILYSCIVLVANAAYRALAKYLTDQENHKLESSYQNYLIAKIVLFDFVNNFFCLFYIAFVYNDINMLRRTLRNLFFVQIIISQTMESVVPYWSYQRETRSERSGDKESADILSQAELDLKRDRYGGAFDDYLEMWLQFGYVVLFSCVFPFASVLSLVNNLVEIRSDAFKLCKAFRRPFSTPTRNIGAWQVAFEVTSYLGVITNCALIFQSDVFQKWFYGVFKSSTTLDLVVAFIIAEHVLLTARFLLSAMIPTIPEHIDIKVAKTQFQSHQALKRQRASTLLPTGILEKLRTIRSVMADQSSAGTSE